MQHHPPSRATRSEVPGVVSSLRSQPQQPVKYELRFTRFEWIALLIAVLLLCIPIARAQGQIPPNPPNVSNDACDLDFNNSGFVDDEDLRAFVRVYSEGPCAVLNDGSEDTLAPPCDSIDFNKDGSLYDPADLDAYRIAHEGGPCPNGFYPLPRWYDQVRIWLAPSWGSDDNDGITRATAVATPKRAYMLVQNAMYANRPWAVVIPRGEVIIGPLRGEYGAWSHGGTGGKPGYIGADPDDPASMPRPRFVAYDTNGFKSYGGNIRLISLEFEGNGCDGCVGVQFFGRASGGMTDVVISDVLCKEFSGGFAIQGAEKADPIKRVLVSRSVTKWNFRVSGYAQGVFVSCADGVTFDQFVMQQNGYRLANPVDWPDVGSHNAYTMPNSTNVHYVGCVTVEASATGDQLRGMHQTARGCVSINNPLGITAGHAQAMADEDSSAHIVGNLIIGGGNIQDQPPPSPALPRSLSVGINRAAGVVVKDNIIWRDPVEGIAMNTGAAFWLQGADHQAWDISANVIYEPRYNPQGLSLSPIVRDDRPAGSVPSARAILDQNTILTTIPAEWTAPPSVSTYLDMHGVNVFEPQFAGRTFGEMASRNRRGAWRDEFTAHRLIKYWRDAMKPAE